MEDPGVYVLKTQAKDVYDPKNFLRDYQVDTDGLSGVPFGRSLMKEFGLDQNTIFFNHGSYGTVPNRVLKLQHEYNVERESHPDLWFRINAKQYMDKTRQDVASFINAKVENVMLVSNATTGMNGLVKSYPFKAGDALLDTTVTYGAIKNLAHDVTNRVRPDVKRIHLNIGLPIKDEDEIVAKYEAILNQNPNIKVALLDHITSPSSVIMPLSRLIELCHSKGVVVFVDGAHSIGQIPLDLEALKPDAYTSNLHKWCYTPRGCAFVWFDERHRDWISPPNTSWQLLDSLDLQFFDQGTRDHVPFICGQHGLQFYNAVGGMDRIVGYTSKLAADALDMLCEKLGLERLAIPAELEAPNLKLIKFPTFPNYPATEDNVWTLHKELFGNTNIFGILVPIEGSFYLRFSVQIYNEMEDFVKLADILKPFLEKFSKE